MNMAAVILAFQLAGCVSHDGPPIAETPSIHHSWEDASNAGDYKQTADKARAFLIAADPSFKKMFDETSVTFLNNQSGPGHRQPLGVYSMVNGKPRMDITKDHSGFLQTYTLIKKRHADDTNPPSAEDIRAVLMAVTLAHETGHFWQSKANPAFFRQIEKQKFTACPDIYDLEQSADEFMTFSALKMHENMDGQEKKALEWVMESQGFENFAAFAQDSGTEQGRTLFRAFMAKRKALYRSASGCPADQPHEPGLDAAKALTGPAGILRAMHVS